MVSAAAFASGSALAAARGRRHRRGAAARLTHDVEGADGDVRRVGLMAGGGLVPVAVAGAPVEALAERAQRVGDERAAEAAVHLQRRSGVATASSW